MTRGRALALVAAVSLLFHLKGLTAPPLDYHYHRQVNTLDIARNYARNGLHFLSPQVDFDGPYRGRTATEFPLYMWLIGLLWPVAGLGEVWGRVLSVGFSALGACYLYLFLERRLTAREALWASLLFSAIPVQVYFGRTIQPEALALAGTLAAFYHFDRYLDDGSALQWATAVLAAALAIGHKLPYGYMLLPLAGLAYFRRGWAAFKSPLTLAAAPLCLAGVFAWYKYASTGPYVVPAHADEFESLLRYKWFYIQFQMISRLPEIGATWAGVALAVPGSVLLWRRGERFFHLWWVSVAVYIALGGAYCFAHEYTSLPWAPVMAAFMGVGAAAGWERARSSSQRAGLAAVVALVPILGFFRIKHWYNQNFPHLAGARKAAAQVSGPDDLFLCNQRASSIDLYYLDRHGWSFALAEQGGEQAIPLVQKRIADGARFFETSRDNFRSDHAAWFDAHYPKVYDDGLLVIYKLDEKAPAVAAKSKRRR
jgi:4-amino-4-deoxy-L-arabinose transferase-like glycosyltransferase